MTAIDEAFIDEETSRRFLTEAEICDIKTRLSRGDTQQEVADMYGVARSTIANYAPESVLPPLGLGQVPEWMDRGICHQTDPESFFPEKGGSTREAKAICARCPVAAECLDYALDNDERFGIWGGLSERDRRAVKRALHPEACPDPNNETAKEAS